MVALGAVLFAGASVYAAESGGAWAGRAVPPFSAHDIDGKVVSLSGLLGGSKAVVVNFWGVRCQTCIEEMPSLGDLWTRLGPRGLRVVGVNTDGIGWEEIQEFLPAMEVRPEYTLLCDPEFKVMDAYRVTAVPFTLVIRPDGKATYEHLGYAAGDEKALEQEILKLIDSPDR